ncbi:hypothetical protein [Streptomyces sp. NPDC088400]|uniref:hypothetical protein n=1 Tax=Streptomyces sp. NPDC088400 TaxID=3365861 RepID=UPI0037FF0341
MKSPERVTRLLPWGDTEGKPCYLLTDSNGGHVSRLADEIESVQLSMGRDLIQHARPLLDDSKATCGELRFLAARLTESLRDVLRVAESRGARLPLYDDVGQDDEPASG